jgi:hypothetical protein
MQLPEGHHGRVLIRSFWRKRVTDSSLTLFQLLHTA